MHVLTSARKIQPLGDGEKDLEITNVHRSDDSKQLLL
jgi:hypothetical protein